jgi:hypothetical protein
MALGNQTTNARDIALSIGAAASSYFVFTLIFGSLSIFAFLVGRRSTHFGHAFIITISMFAIFLAWLRAFRLEVRNGVLIYRSLFNGTRSIAISDIRGADTKVGASSSLGPFIQLVITPVQECAGKPIIINMKVFSRKDITKLHDLLKQNNIAWRKSEPLL